MDDQAADDGQESLEARRRRVKTAIQLDEPDRVPFVPFFSFFPAYYAGYTPREVMYDYEKAFDANRQAVLDFAPDMYIGPAVFRSGPVLETLGCTQLLWPGHGVDPENTYQFNEQEYMPAEEYDEYIEDPSDWLLRRYMPRVYESLEALADLPSLFDQFYYYGAPSAGLAAMGDPDIQEAFETMLEAARESKRWVEALGEHVAEMESLGFPAFYQVATYAPFDLLADNFRGTQGALVDMHRRPDTLHEALEVTTTVSIRMATRREVDSEVPLVFIPLHKGSDQFMSPEQYEEFYWPYLKALIEALVDAGFIPYVYTEGPYDTRLEHLTDVPRGKVLYNFEHVDMARAAELLGDVACIAGDVPMGLIQTGEPEAVEDYCRELIDTAGPGGGFILSSAASIEEAPPENIKAMEETTKEYGRYPLG
ncbi:MAG: uroporphyrinogen decarboxylase family protein [Halobacteriales archaeon]